MSDFRGEPLLQAHRLGCSIAGRALWRDLDFKLNDGERLAIAGPSGSGKTVLLRTLAGLAPLQEGEIRFQQRSLTDWPMPAYRARVVYLPQRPALPEGTVEAAIRAPFRFRVRRGTNFPETLLGEYLNALSLGQGFLAQRGTDLSGGESQLAAALRALLVEPTLLMLDEPTASLDDAAVRRLETLIQRWMTGGAGRACIWTSHDQGQLERVCDRLLMLTGCGTGETA